MEFTQNQRDEDDEEIKLDASEFQDLKEETYFKSLENLINFCDGVSEFYADMRTKNQKGITIQSQIRFLRMFALYLLNRFKIQNMNSQNYQYEISTRFSFYCEVFGELASKTLEELRPSKNIPVLAPLIREKREYRNVKIKMYKIECIGYKQDQPDSIEILDREVKELFKITKKDKKFYFNDEKNPELSGDFEIRLRIGKLKLGAWFNVPFLVQIAHLEQT